MDFPFTLPPLVHNGIAPVWVGDGFQVGSEFCKIIQYSTNTSGWSNDLTLFHEHSESDDHFIAQASRKHTIAQLKKNITHPTPTFVEIGCSSGTMLCDLKKAFPHAFLIGIDVINEPLLKLSQTLPEVPLIRADITQCPLPDDSIDAIIMLNVLEHIKEDQLALAHIYRMLKSGGLLILEVPAGPNLYDIYDQVLMHFRRYSLKQLKTMVSQQGFFIQQQSHLGFFIFPAFWLVKQYNKLKYKNSGKNAEVVEKNIRSTRNNKILHYLTQAELMLGQFFSYPFGIRCTMTCIK